MVEEGKESEQKRNGKKLLCCRAEEEWKEATLLQSRRGVGAGAADQAVCWMKEEGRRMEVKADEFLNLWTAP